MTLRRPALIVHTFFVVGAAGTPGRQAVSDRTADAVSALWHRTAALGITEPVDQHPTELPTIGGPGSGDLELLAARRQVVPGAAYVALAYRRRDIVVVSVLLAPNDDRVGWQALSDRWAAAVPATSGAELSTTTIYLGMTKGVGAGPTGRRAGDPGRRARRVRGQVPGPSDEPDGESWCRVADRLLLWDLPADGGYGQRRHLLLADPADGPALDRLTWPIDRFALPPTTRHLLNVAELQHQQVVLEAAVPSLHAAVRETERACETLADLLSTTAEPSRQQLRSAARDLEKVQAQQGGLVWASADASTMAGTVLGIRNNMAAVLDRELRCRPGGPLDRDRDCAVWLTDQIDIELAYLDAAWRRADRLGGLAAAVIGDRQRRHQEGLVLLHGSILSALLMVLSAIQSLGYKVPLRGPLVSPSIWLLGLLALLLPAAVLYWPRSGGEPSRRGRFVAGGLAMGAALGWFGASVGWWAARGVPAPAGWSGILAAVGAMAFASTAWWATRRRQDP